LYKTSQRPRLSAFLSNQVVGEQLNKIHLVVGGISPTAPQGVGTAQFIGTLYRPYVSIFGYAEAHGRSRHHSG
jgi:hypothetical protein